MTKIVHNSMGQGAIPAARWQVPEYANPVSGPYVGWDPVQFQKVCGFAGDIRSVSGVFRDRSPNTALTRRLLRHLKRSHQWMMRFAEAGGDVAGQRVERKSLRYFDAIYRWAFCARVSEIAFPRIMSEGLVHLLNHHDAVRMAFAVWDEKVCVGERTFFIPSIMGIPHRPTEYVLSPVSKLVQDGGTVGAAAFAALTHLSECEVLEAIVQRSGCVLGGKAGTAPMFTPEGIVSIGALRALREVREYRSRREEELVAHMRMLASRGERNFDLLGRFNEFVGDVDAELQALLEDAHGWCLDFGRRLEGIDNPTIIIEKLGDYFDDLPLNDQVMRALAEAAAVSYRAYCYLKIFADSNEAAVKYFNDPAYSASFKTSLDEGEDPDGGNE